MNEDLVFERNCQILFKARSILYQEAKETPWSAEETLQFALVIILSCFQDGFSAFFCTLSFFSFWFSFLSSSAL